MKNTLRRLVPVSCLCLLFACVSIKPMRTPSGNPEIVVRTAQPAVILEELTIEMALRGYEKVMVSDRLGVFTKPCEDFDTAFFYGKGWNASADFAATLLLDEAAGGVRVLIDMEIVTDAGTADERRAPVPQGHPEAHVLQDMLEVLVADMALRRHEELWPDEEPRPSEPRVWTGEG